MYLRTNTDTTHLEGLSLHLGLPVECGRRRFCTVQLLLTDVHVSVRFRRHSCTRLQTQCAKKATSLKHMQSWAGLQEEFGRCAGKADAHVSFTDVCASP